MSHPTPSHDRSNEYPEDKVTRYPSRAHKNALYHTESEHAKKFIHNGPLKKRMYRMTNEANGDGGPLHRVANHLDNRVKALKKLMEK